MFLKKNNFDYSFEIICVRLIFLKLKYAYESQIRKMLAIDVLLILKLLIDSNY